MEQHCASIGTFNASSKRRRGIFSSRSANLVSIAAPIHLQLLLFGVLGLLNSELLLSRVAEVAREHGWHPPKSLDSDENFKPEHTLYCRELRFVAIYALFLEIFVQKKCLFG